MTQSHPRAARDGIKCHREPDLKAIEYQPTGIVEVVKDEDYGMNRYYINHWFDTVDFKYPDGGNGDHAQDIELMIVAELMTCPEAIEKEVFKNTDWSLGHESTLAKSFASVDAIDFWCRNEDLIKPYIEAYVRKNIEFMQQEAVSRQKEARDARGAA